MKTITFLEKTNTSGQPIKIGKQLVINATKTQKGTTSTKSIYVRTAFLNDTPFLSQKGLAGDIIKLSFDENVSMLVGSNLFERIKIFAGKNGLIIKK